MNQNTIVIILISVGVLLLFSFLGASKSNKEAFENSASSNKAPMSYYIYNPPLIKKPIEYIKNAANDEKVYDVFEKVIKRFEEGLKKVKDNPKQELESFIKTFPEFKDAPESFQISEMEDLAIAMLNLQKYAFEKLKKRDSGTFYYYDNIYGCPYIESEKKQLDEWGPDGEKRYTEILKERIDEAKKKEATKNDKKKYDEYKNKYEEERKDLEENSNKKNQYSYDNYDHFSKTSVPTTFYGPNGTKASVMNKNDKFEIIITGSNGKTTTYSTSKSNGAKKNDPENKNKGSAESIGRMMKQFENSTFYGPGGGSARFFTGKDGQYAVEETKANGDTTIYTSSNTYTFNYKDKEKSYDNSGSKSKSDSLEYSNDKKGGQNKTSASEVTKGNIPHGKEDLYILKSQIVPPVCPVCPTAAMCADKIKAKCPPCPACARCPEPNFDCKKVPSYYSNSESRNPYSSYSRGGGGGGGGFDATGSFNRTGGSSGNMPVPVMSDFSTFGM
uniref:Uncharacterized protein n=1 Tax=viral metagenome TaxID=1070528 RepID=A0A6C0D7T5_9ZZZZ